MRSKGFIIEQPGVWRAVVQLAAIFVAAASIESWATKEGMAIALQAGGEQWVPGNLVLVSVPSNDKRVLITGSCMGPCFSPDGRRIAVFVDGEITTLNIDGSDIVGTGITVTLGACRCWFIGGNTALYWMSLKDGEYLYWFDANSPGTFRARVGTWEEEQLDNKLYFWGGFSADGRRAAAVSEEGADRCWSVTAIDMSKDPWERRQVHFEEGCNVSVSPDGQYIWHLLNGGGEFGGTQHEYSLMRRFDDGSVYKKIDSYCNHSTTRWSHYDDNILVYHHYNKHNGAQCDQDGDFGVVMDLTTDERFNIGDNLFPFDFYPGITGPGGQQCNPVDFSPPPGKYVEGATSIYLSTSTPGASIRYTTDGTMPTAARGELLGSPPDNSVSIDISLDDTVTINAIAFKPGTNSSGVSAAPYWAGVAPFTITSPAAGDNYAVGDSLRIQWATRPGFDVRSDVSLSVDGGLTFLDILGASVSPGTPQWQDVAWKIPDSLNDESLASETAFIRINAYGQESEFGLSGAFAISKAMGAVARTGRGSALRRLIVAREPVVRIPLDCRRPGPWAVEIRLTNGMLVYRARGVAAPSELRWNGVGRNGHACRSGLYCVRIRQGEKTSMRIFSLQR